ncbi:MAG: aliphatic sulfonates family transporter, periplasmic ligand-binding protein [Acidimicrobiales bacterium]|nr:aliphatic sulfonates family transporter, periplasmic ligand-binding protein [Acidimicrobiales bacterium]
MSTQRRRAIPVLIIATAVAVLASLASPAAAQSKPVTLRLGYFPNLTHGSAIVGVEKGFFKQALGSNKLSLTTFNAGPAATEALLSGAIDATYIGPNPAINAYVKSKAIKIISGSASGGALFVVGEGVGSAAELKGTKIATPQLGGTQDVAARYWLKTKGLKTTTNGGGDVSIVPQDNGQTLDAFKSHAIAGAWVPEPWATRILQEAGAARVLVDERSLWPQGKFVTTHLIVSTKFLKEHPDVVNQLLVGQIRANQYIHTNPKESKAAIDKGIERVTGKGIASKTIDAAWKNLDFTNDPIASSLQSSADHAVEVNLLSKPALKGIYQLGPLNSLLTYLKQPTVKDGGLG